MKKKDTVLKSLRLTFSKKGSSLKFQSAKYKDIIQSWNDVQGIELYASFCNVLISRIFNIRTVSMVACDLNLKDFGEDFIYVGQGVNGWEITT